MLMPLILGLFLTLLATPALIWAAHRYSFLDHPDERKQHAGSIPLVGGVAMSVGIVISAGYYLADAGVFWALFLSVSIVVVVGLMDDRADQSVKFRFLAQGAAALIMALFAGAQLGYLGDLFGFGPIAMGAMTVPFSIFAMVGIANAINLSDGMDGLAGGLALIAATFIGAAAYVSGMELELKTMLILGGALIGFLFFNMRFPWQRHAKVFMGDSGSLMLGFLLAWGIFRVTQSGADPLPPAASLWFIAIPLWDTVSLMLRRMLKGKSPFHPGRDHLHHILLRVGYTDGQVVFFIHMVAVACGLIGFLGWRWGVSDTVLCYGFLAVFALYVVGVQHAWRLMRLMMPLQRHS